MHRMQNSLIKVEDIVKLLVQCTISVNVIIQNETNLFSCIFNIGLSGQA